MTTDGFGWGDSGGGGGGGADIQIGVSEVIDGTQGSILFVGSGGLLQQDNANLFYDDTLNFVGFGTNAPAARVNIVGSGNTAGTYALIVQNAAQTANSLIIDNTGHTGFGAAPDVNYQMRIMGDSGIGAILASTSGAANAITGSASGGGVAGVKGTSSSGSGYGVQGASTSGHCFYAETGDGHGITTYAGTNGRCFFFQKIGAGNSIGIMKTFSDIKVFDFLDNGAMGNFTAVAPVASVSDGYLQYSADITAGNAAPHFRTEDGDIIRLFTSPSYSVTNVVTDRTFDAGSSSVNELANVLGTLIGDLQATGLIG